MKDVRNPEFYSIEINRDCEKNVYLPEKDSKWRDFMKKHGLRKFSHRWYDLYLRLCAADMVAV